MYRRSRVNVKVEPHSTFTFYTWPFIHCLFFIYARKFHVRLHGKITRQWKSNFRMLRASFRYPCTQPHTHTHILRAFSRVPSPVFGFQLIVVSGPFFKVKISLLSAYGKS